MKIDIKKILCKSIMALMVIPFFLVNFVPVHADYSVELYPINSNSVAAYIYWNNMGFNLTETNSVNTTISIPSYTFNTGNTQYDLVCNEPNYTGQEGDYACFYRNRSNGQVSGTWMSNSVVNHTETVQNISVLGVNIPWISGNYIHDSSFVYERGIQVEGHSTYYISFISTKNLWTSSVDNRYFKTYNYNGYSKNFEYGFVNRIESYGNYKYTFYLKNNDAGKGYVCLDFPLIDSSTKIIPLFNGYIYDITDDMAQLIGIDTPTETALNNISSKMDSILTLSNTQTQAAVNTNNSLISGNPTSQAAQSALDNSNTTLNNRVDQMNNIETEYNSDLNAALDDIDLSTDLVQHTGFTNAALWVAAQFNRLVVGTPLELVVIFSLITGLALVLIGKVRG